jgi:hypothetical protein
MKRALFTSALAGAGVVGILAACDDTTGLRSERVSLTLRVPQSRSLSSATALQASGSPITVAAGTHTLDLDDVEVTFSRVDLERVDDFDDDNDSDSDGDSDHGEDSDRDTDSDQADNVRLRGPFTVDLPLNGGVITPVTVAVPFGTYDEVKFRVASVRLVGEFDGEAFNVVVPIREKFEVDIRPPLVVDDATDLPNVTVTFVPADWLRDRDGSLIDPRRLDSDKRLRAQFRNRIRAALRAFRDTDRDGDSDSDRH